jgi:hypothetical protein
MTKKLASCYGLRATAATMNPPRADCAPPRAACDPPRADCEPPDCEPPDCEPPDCEPPDCDPEDTIPTGKYSGQTVDDTRSREIDKCSISKATCGCLTSPRTDLTTTH